MHNVILLVYVIFLIFYVGFAVMILSVTKKHFPTDAKMALARRIFMIGTLVLVTGSLILVVAVKPDYGRINIGINLGSPGGSPDGE